jgi:5-carboxymethyl-2-hydroxymuconic-semialdehyde dehydrogenase
MSELQQNLSAVNALLEKYKSQTLPHFIDGERVIGKLSFDNFCPFDNELIGKVSNGTEADVDSAANAAKSAFPSWSELVNKDRREILHGIAESINRRAEEIALLESYDTGQPVRYMNKAAVRGAENFRFFADRIEESRNGLALDAAEHVNYTRRNPIGPIGIITPWNTPFMLSTWKIAPALAAGCTIVHKPAELSPLTATLLSDIADSAGVPAGVWNTVHGLGQTAGVALTEHPALKAIAFVGESATGKQIMKQGADTLKRVHFELGGKNPVIVFDDADLDRALDAVIFMIYSLNGERCTSSSRLLIQSTIHESFVRKLKARIAKIRMRHPLDPQTEIGPLISRAHYKKVKDYISIGKGEGCRVFEDWYDADTRRKGRGNFVSPTLITHASSEMRIAREEVFGPVLTIIPFSDEKHAVSIANDSPFGLAAYIWTNNIGLGHRLAHMLETGMVWVNSENNRHLPSPFGGTKESGIGRDGGDYSFDFYMETKNICVALGTHKIPTLGNS